MRTTVTLDPDVERLLKSAARERGVSFKQALNEAIRAGVTPANAGRKRRFVQKTYSLGPEQNFRWEIEDEKLIRR